MRPYQGIGRCVPVPGRVCSDLRCVITSGWSVCEVMEEGELILLQLGEVGALFREVIAVLDIEVKQLLMGKAIAHHLQKDLVYVLLGSLSVSYIV